MKWPLAKFAEVALPVKGAIVSGPFGSNIGKRFFVEEGVPVIRGNNLTFGERRFVDDGFVYLTEEKASEFRNCEAVAGDLVFTAAGTIGQVAIIPSETRFSRYIISNKQLRVRCDKEKVCPLFLFLWFTTDHMRQHLINQNRGCSVPLINLGTLRSLPVPLPPLHEQRRIAAIVAAYDDAMENNRRRMALLEKAARLLYEEWFVRLRFPGHEHTRKVDGVPEGWERGPLGNQMTLQRGHDLPLQDRTEGDVPIVSSSGITGFHNVKKADAPGVVTGRYGTLGQVYYIDCAYWPLNTSLYVVDFKENPPIYVLHLLGHTLGMIQSDKAAVPGLNRNVLHAIAVLSPPRRLRESFGEFAEPIYRQIATLRKHSENLRAARDLLLPRLMNGEIEV